MIRALKDKVIQGSEIDCNEANALSQFNEKEELYKAANEIREHFTGNSFELCSIINARSGRCPEDCKWCAQSVHYNTQIEEYALISSWKALSDAKQNEKLGIHRYSLVTSGKSVSVNELNKICEIYKQIKKENNIRLCASLGLIGYKQLCALKESGVEQYHCNLETASSFFPKMCSTHFYHEKIETIKNAMKAGLSVCSGGIIGMGETMEQRIEMAFELRALGVKSVPVNILYPIPGTPLESIPMLSDDEILTTIAVFRFILPDAKLRFAGGRTRIIHLQKKMLHAGINAALVGDMLTTAGTNFEDDIRLFKDAGFRFLY
ncbi:MAG: biotin synthase BioB [Bacteroidia bacterium]|nr:biotin synthase BioB [Bacteroidia bacterium]